MTTLWPALDLMDGKVVRLRQGRAADLTIYSNDPVAFARDYVSAGARALHLVDLDGAFAGSSRNGAVIRAIREACPGIEMQAGGGLRDLASIESMLGHGIDFAILGTRALEPVFLREACARFPGRIRVGIGAADLAERARDAGANGIIYTQIVRDGMQSGADVEGTVAIAKRAGIPTISSGGIGSLADLAAAKRPEIAGVIVGKALCERNFSIGAALAALA